MSRYIFISQSGILIKQKMETKENSTMEILIHISFSCSQMLVVCFIFECLLSFLKRKKKNIKTFHVSFRYIISFALCLLFIVYKIELCTSEPLYLLYTVCASCVYVWLRQLNYSHAQINLSLEDSESIGALWAHQAYEAYYKIILEKITDRIRNFEEKHNVEIFPKKLLLVIPLSCDIEGTFKDRDCSIKYFGLLDIIENDAGGNINRKFKNPVFKICSLQDRYIVAEFSQPVSALKRSLHILKDEKFTYIRDCYIKTLKSLLQGSPCIFVLHNDENGSETLSSCILSTVEKDRSQMDFTA